MLIIQNLGSHYCKWLLIKVSIFLPSATKEAIPGINNVNFLGMSLSSEDTTTGLNTTFALLIVALAGTICVAVGLFPVKGVFQQKIVELIEGGREILIADWFPSLMQICVISIFKFKGLNFAKNKIFNREFGVFEHYVIVVLYLK